MRKQARLDFDRCPATLVGCEGAGREVLERVMDLAALALSLDAVGGAKHVLHSTVAYVKERR